jgi:hypothetical protein
MPGYAGNYTVVTAFNSGTLELSFGKSKKGDMGDNERHVLEIFQIE